MTNVELLAKAIMVYKEYNQKVCEGWCWEDVEYDPYSRLYYSHYLDYVWNEDFEVVVGKNASDLEIVELIESYNKTVNNPLMCGSKAYESACLEIRLMSTQRVEVKLSKIRTPYLQYCMEVCVKVLNSSLLERNVLELEGDDLNKVLNDTLEDRCEYFIELLESLNDVDEERLSMIEFTDKTVDGLIESKKKSLEVDLQARVKHKLDNYCLKQPEPKSKPEDPESDFKEEHVSGGQEDTETHLWVFIILGLIAGLVAGLLL